MLALVEQRLGELSLRTFDKSSRGAFNVLQHVDALWHDLSHLSPSQYVGASALLFSQSFPHNILDFLSLAIKSHELSKDLVEERNKLYECLTDFVKRTGAVAIQDHLVRLCTFTEFWIKAENSSKTLQSCLHPMQAALEQRAIEFTVEQRFNAGKFALVLKERYLYGKASESVSPSVKGGLLLTLGLLCSRCPKPFAEKEPGASVQSKETLGGSLRRLCIACLDDQLKSGDPNLALLTGTLTGLRFLLVGSPCEVGEQSREANQIYTCVRHLMKVTKEVKRFDVPAQAITLLLYHSPLFAPQLIKEPDALFDDLRQCVHSKNDKIKHVAMPCCLEVLKTIAKCLNGPEEDEDDDEEEEVHAAEAEEEEEILLPSTPVKITVTLDTSRRKSLLNLFMKRFIDFIQVGLKPNAAGEDMRLVRKDIDLAIHGFGLFAKTIVALTDEQRLAQVMYKLFELSDRLKQHATMEDNDDADHPYRVSKRVNAKLFQRIRFLYTYGKIALYLPASVLENELVLDRFQNEILSLQEDYSAFNPERLFSSPYAFNRAVEQILHGVAGKGSCLPELLSRIVKPLLVHTLSAVKRNPDENDNAGQEEEEFVYDALWCRLLPGADKQQDKAKEETFDRLISVVLHIIPELNLECSIVGSTTVGAQEEEEQTMSSSYLLTVTSEHIVPRNVQDLRRFHLLTLFLHQHRTVTDTHLLPYMPMFTRIVSNGLDKNPLISSWYRLMSLAFSALDKTAYSMDQATMSCLDTFLETTCLRANQYQDELLAASLTCVLQCPHGALLEKHMRNLSNCLVTALRMGLSHVALAELAMDQLERWIALVHNRTLLVDLVFPIVLPELAGYLSSNAETSSSSHAADTDENSAAAAEETSNLLEQDEEEIRRWRASQRHTRHRRSVQLVKEKIPLDVRAVRILGSVGGHNRLVLPKLEKVLMESKSWDPIKRVEIALPLFSSTSKHPLMTKIDGILPRVALLATSSIHRQTKIAACELLHSLVLVMLGTSASSPEEKGGEYFVKIYIQLFPSLLQLAVDVDSVARQLFLPLVEQLSKWFARDENSSEASALLQAVIEALGDKSNSALRELAANTLGVFFRWTFKSASAGTAVKKPKLSLLNSTTMLYHLYSLMRHPDPFKRLGSCAAFDAFYRDFREQNTLVDEHTLLFLENALISLRLSHYDPPALATGEAANQVVSRIKRILIERSAMFKQANTNRLAFEDLGAFQDWVFSLCASPETLLRARAHELYEALAGCCESDSEARNGLSSQWSDDDCIPALQRGNANTYDEPTARVHYDYWRTRSTLVCTREEDGLESSIATLISETCQFAMQTRTAEEEVSPRQASGLCRFLRTAANWSNTNYKNHSLLEMWECLLEALVHPQRLGLDLEDREYRASVPAAFQVIVRQESGANKAIAGLIKMRFPSELAEIQIQTGRVENSALLRAAMVFTKANIRILKDSEVDHLAACVYRMPFGTSPQSLKDGSALLRLCFELKWPVSSLLSALLNTTVLSEFTTASAATIGFTFFKHFSTDICAHLCKFPQALGPLLEALNVKSLSSSPRSSQAFQVLSTLLKDPTTATNTDFAATFFPLLANFSQVCVEVIPLLGQIMRLPVAEEEEDENEGVRALAFRCFHDLLSIRAANQFPIKFQLVEYCLAPFLLPVTKLSDRATALFEREIVGNYFPPITASKLVVGSADCNAYINLLGVTFDILAETHSLLLLQVLCTRAIKEYELAVHCNTIQVGLNHLARSVPVESTEEFIPLALECMKSLTKEASDSLKRSKMALFDFFLVPLCGRFSAEQWEALLLSPFHQEKGNVFEYLMYMIQQPLSEDASKECCYKVLQCLFRFASLEVVQRIQRSAFPANQAGNEATKIISKQARKILMDEAESSVHHKTAGSTTAMGISLAGEAENLVSAFSPKERLCNAVYSCLVAVVEKTQSQAKFFDSLVFANGCNVLHALIPHRVDHLTEPKFTVREHIATAIASAVVVTPVKEPKRTASTNNSLAITSVDDEDEVRAAAEEDDKGPVVSVLAPPPTPKPASTPPGIQQQLLQEDETAAMERDCFNTLPAMEAMLLAIDGMRRKDLINLQPAAADAPLPPFCTTLLDALNDRRGSGGDGRQSLNVRLFAAKVVLNRSHLFSCFAKHFTVPLAELVYDLEFVYVEKPALFRGFHSFIQDICHLLLVHFDCKPEWFTTYDDRQALARLCELLFRLCRSSAQVDLCAALLQKFQALKLMLDMHDLLAHASKAGIAFHQQRDDPEALPQAKIALALLRHCGALGYLATAAESSERLADMLVTTLSLPRLSTGMTRQCARVLAYAVQASDGQSSALRQLLETLLNRGDDTERCLDILAGLMESQPAGRAMSSIVSRDVFTAVLRLVAVLEGDYLKYGLDVVQHSIKEDNAIEIYQAVFPLLLRGKLLSADNAHLGSIVSYMELVQRLGQYPQVAQRMDTAAAEWMQAVSTLLFHHPAASIRLRAFEYLSKSGGGKRSILVAALSDPNSEIQKRAFEYWERESPDTAPMDRLLHLLETMNPGSVVANDAQHNLAIRKRVEATWVCQVSQLLLAMARKSENYFDATKSLIFKDPLNATHFEDVHVTTATTNNFQGNDELMHTPLFLSSTQQSGGGGASYFQTQDTNVTATGMLVRATQQVNNLFAPTQSDSQNPASQASSSSTGQQRVRRRVGKQVVVLRKYRKGEVPDVQIGQKELIEPLLALCGLDAKVAFHFLIALVPVLLLDKPQTDVFAQMDMHLTALLESEPSETLFATCLIEFFTSLATTPGSEAEIDPKLVGTQSLHCKTYATGVFALESYILRQAKPKARSKKQARTDGGGEAWKQLYSLYDALNETDVLLGLSERSSKEIHLATTLDLTGKQSEAIELYGQIINQNLSSASDTAFECYLARSRCFQKLRKWDDSFQELDVLIKPQEVFYSDKGKRMLTLYLRSGIKSTAQQNVNKTLLFLDKFASHADLFEQCIPAELVQAELVRSPAADWGRALDRTNRAVHRFLRDFSSQPLLAVNTRRVLVQPLPQFSTFLDAFAFRKHSTDTVQFFSQLESSAPLESQDGPEVWEAVYSQRLLLLSLLRPAAAQPQFEIKMETHLLDLLNKSFRQAVRTQNFDIAKVVVREMKRLSVDVFPQSALLSRACNNASVDLVFANRSAEEYASKLDRALQLLQRDAQEEDNNTPDYYKRLGRISKALGRFPQAIQAFEQRCALLKDSGDQTVLAKAHYDLGSLAEEQNSAEVAITNLLIAFQLGNPMASNAFPRVLKLALQLDDASVFKQYVADIPTISLLKWTAQLLSVFNQSQVADQVLERIAREFPQSFVYPFRVSREAMMTLNSASVTPQVKLRLERLNRSMSLPHVVNLFCDSLERLTHPELRIRDLLKQMQTLVTQQQPETARKVYKDKILGEVFAAANTRGKYHADFAKQFEAKIRNELDAGITAQSIQAALRVLPQGAQKFKSGKCALSEFSTWLDNFALLGNKQIEVPGSRDPWTSSSMTSTSNNHTVLAFDSELLVMGSMRVPKRLTIRGMDNSKNDFLVKGGEDLRLDERIEQLFGLMNRLMELDVDCASRGLKMQTYKVIPVSLSCGLIEWIPNSAPVKQIIETQYAIQQQKQQVSLEQMPCEEAFRTFAAQHERGLKNRLDMYSKLYTVSDATLQREYMQIKQTVPSDLLRSHVLGLSATPEAFLTLKHNFAQSLAVLSICSWLLGIGDRHLDNFMMNALGELVAIDFGYSFGIGVVMLPVAETLPFRFTPQFSEFLAPLNANGTFFHCARRTLTCLREGRSRLLEVMEVFVNEPLLDWVSQAGLTNSSTSSSAVDSQQDSWKALSSSRVRVADLKLRGVRPSLVMSAELMERKRPSDAMIEAVCRSAGQKQDQVGKTCKLKDADSAKWITDIVSVPEQVEELTRMATNEAMLMRQWQGSRCWI